LICLSSLYTKNKSSSQSIYEQFRRFANLYFLAVGIVMFIGTYSNLFKSAISPWSTLGPLAFVVMISMLVEGSSDYKRHLNDAQVNNTDCVVLQRRPKLGQPGDHFHHHHSSPSGREKKSKNGPSSSMTTTAAIRRDQSIMNGRDVLVNVNKAYYANAGSTVRGNRSRTMTDPNDPAAEMVEISFSLIPRKDIRQGMIVLVKNREMVPADIVLLASSNDKGGAYIETSSIDGETNLKLRNSPHLPKEILSSLREQLDFDDDDDDENNNNNDTSEPATGAGVGKRQLRQEFESVEAAVKRLTRFSALGRPEGTSALEHDDMVTETNNNEETIPHSENKVNTSLFKKRRTKRYVDEGKYVAALTTEPPNASVHTFSGKLTLPPFGEGSCQTIPLGSDNILLRGAVIRNTEWVLGVACFTGAETKLVKNSFATPSKFSQLDRLMNKTVMTILLLMFVIIGWLATLSVLENDDRFDELVYIGYNNNDTELWPYFTGSSAAALPRPKWIAISEVNNWLQFFLQFITLVSNMIPLSLYVTIEMIQFIMMWFIANDADMYDATTDTRAQARSTIVSDLGRIQYIFSDKTGTLTQNVMRFKRCSVDGLAFGAPIPRMRQRNENEDNDEVLSSFHPVRQLLVGRFTGASRPPGLEGFAGETTSEFSLMSDDRLTFNAEMFLRVMSLCHTVVVEKDIENKDQIGNAMSEASTPGPRRTKSYSRTSSDHIDQLSPVSEGKEDADSLPSRRSRSETLESMGRASQDETGPDGAPAGYAYQAESPDEGALVSAASSLGFQVITRDRNGILLRTPAPSHLEDERVVSGLKSKSLLLGRIAAKTAHQVQRGDSPSSPTTPKQDVFSSREPRDEIWEIMAVNKFDSDRKRMSILLRSPENLGGLPILFCKGADSAMLDPEVSNNEGIMKGGGDSINMNHSFDLPPVQEKHEDVDEVGSSLATSLGLQMHLGEFAREGLRTLVLAMKVLTEEECFSWLETYNAAATSLQDRNKLLTAAAKEIERNLHIVGATAIEDKLQVKVPETIAKLEQAGIKLWVLTGDKRETAVEIGYSTNVLTSKMCLTEVPDNGKQHVRAQLAMEFIRLTKLGHLSQYQTKSLHTSATGIRESIRQRLNRLVLEVIFVLGKQKRKLQRNMMRIVATFLDKIGRKDRAEDYRFAVNALLAEEKTIIRGVERRRKVRAKAEKTIRMWKQETVRAPTSGHSFSNEDDDLSLTSEELPVVFNRASSARILLNEMKAGGDLASTELRDISLAALTAQQSEGAHHHHGFIDEDALSMDSFAPESYGDLRGIFDRRKRTVLEKMFAVDRQVRKGRLGKHAVAGKLSENARSALQPDAPRNIAHNVDAPRALVIEGAALKHLLGDPDFEDILFAVANCCNAVIACRVSPKQKAELVNLVRKKVEPEPITLAIGDGANDVSNLPTHMPFKFCRTA
jgi:magnesium-transporting ATPase (P-type)